MNTIKKKEKYGFSLVELLVVIAIIGVLTTIGLQSYRLQVSHSYDAEGVAFLNSFRSAMSEYWALKGAFPAAGGSFAGYTVGTTTTLSPQVGNITKLEVNSNTTTSMWLTATLDSSKLNPPSGVANMSFIAIGHQSGQVTFLCGRWNSAAVMPIGYFPTGCNTPNVSDSIPGTVPP